MRTLLVAFKKYYGHVAQDTVNEFENSIKADMVPAQLTGRISRILSKKMLRVMKKKPPLPKFRHTHKFCVVLGLEFYKCFLAFLFNGDNSVYIFDAWTANHTKIEAFIRLMRLKNVFFSSSQVTEIFKAKQLDCHFQWVPEGVTLSDYRCRSYSRKDIDVLAFGRKYDRHHDQIVARLEEKGINYLYEKKKGNIVFKDRLRFIDGLARTKISICTPSDITHPERSGTISTMTIRYLQSMASKALIVGIMPGEMDLLFDYTPIIPLDMEDPAGQLIDILADFRRYIPLIERNYQFIKEHHTWAHRWSQIRQTIENKSEIKPIPHQPSKIHTI